MPAGHRGQPELPQGSLGSPQGNCPSALAAGLSEGLSCLVRSLEEAAKWASWPGASWDFSGDLCPFQQTLQATLLRSVQLQVIHGSPGERLEASGPVRPQR